MGAWEKLPSIYKKVRNNDKCSLTLEGKVSSPILPNGESTVVTLVSAPRLWFA